MTFDYDLFVVGGGSGGVRAARIASGVYGAKVGLAEESRMGGTCVIRGCVPKKLMVFASGYRAEVEDARAYGWTIDAATFDWPVFRDHLAVELDRLEQAYRTTLQNAGVTIHDCRAFIEDAHTVRLATGERFRVKHILIATGGWPAVPDAAAAAGVLTSNDMFSLDRLPETILIVGGGFIACEFACILTGMGVKVRQVYRGAQVLRGFDDESRGHVAELMRDQGVDLHCGTDVMDIRREGHGIWVKTTDGHEEIYDQVLYATGRTPNSAALGLENTGVKLGRRGEIIVDAYSQTAVPSIYAVGDVTNRMNLTPVAIREGHAFADTVFGATPTRADHAGVPSAIFTQPPYGAVGLTEEAARDAGPIEVYATAFRPMKGAFAGRAGRVLMKLIVCADTRRVLGCHIVAPEAAEMIQLAAIAIRMGATKEDFDRTVAVHPTMAEELVTLRKPVRKA